ncbi:hypothetical protein COL922a_008979 [Colletotrichum nupharicola]|nr:hypothetical protein COL922a_008979 [Colletotrichum nupharicola]
MSEGKYNYPNDDEENSRLELQHRIWNLTLDGELALCPAHKTAKNVLDMGTGTGIWAIDYADAFPSAQVLIVCGGFVLPIGCIDNTLFEPPALMRWHETMYEAGNVIGRSIENPLKHVDAIRTAGFVDVTVKRFAWPLNSWPKEKKLKEIGMLHYVNLDLALEGLSLGLFTRALGWTRQEVLDLCAEARMDLKNRKIHAYWNV